MLGTSGFWWLCASVSLTWLWPPVTGPSGNWGGGDVRCAVTLHAQAARAVMPPGMCRTAQPYRALLVLGSAAVLASQLQRLSFGYSIARPSQTLHLVLGVCAEFICWWFFT